jgi:hypothetical protein
VCDVTSGEKIVIGSHEWTTIERARSIVTFLAGVGLLVVANVYHERWLTFLGVTSLAAFAFIASTSGRVVHVTRESLGTVSPFGVRTIQSRDVVEVSAADDPFGSVIVVVRTTNGRALSIPLRVIEEHPEGIVALHQFLDHAIGSGRLDPARVSLKNELAFY